jgi:hypothetical protein
MQDLADYQGEAPARTAPCGRLASLPPADHRAATPKLHGDREILRCSRCWMRWMGQPSPACRLKTLPTGALRIPWWLSRAN